MIHDPTGSWAVLSKAELARIRVLSRQPCIAAASNTLPITKPGAQKVLVPSKLGQSQPPPRRYHILPHAYRSKIPRRPPPISDSELEKEVILRDEILNHRTSLLGIANQTFNFAPLYDDPEMSNFRERILEIARQAESLKHHRANERFALQMKAAESFCVHQSQLPRPQPRREPIW
jgi:hypothetical protein